MDAKYIEIAKLKAEIVELKARIEQLMQKIETNSRGPPKAYVSCAMEFLLTES